MLFYTMQPLSCLLPLKWSIIQSQQHFILCLTLLLLCVFASAGCCDPFRYSPLGSLAFPRPYLLSFIPLDHNNGQPFRLYWLLLVLLCQYITAQRAMVG